MDYKLAELLLRRKELQEKVDQLKPINIKGLFEIVTKRQKVSEDYDEITAQVAKLTPSQVTEEYDYYARLLRLTDAAIQQANWTTIVTVEGTDVMKAFADSKK